MQPPFSVRTALLEDSEGIGAVHTESWKTSYKGLVHQSFLDSLDLESRVAGAKRRFANAELINLVLVENETQRIAGFTTFGRCRDKNVDADGELYAIYLFQGDQRRGGGRLLFAATMDAARARGFTKMMVSVFEANQSSRRFYERMGGVFIGSDQIELEEHKYATSNYLWDLANGSRA